ncbi:MAG: hypothetical protein MRERV_9c051 [Mycoplasmataceae bacterium RV_VA103A]|nr:MAG: hypothetical protein MRERV_9c051 [Mycoplasmataceae bacterium RV_VA103A]
MVTEKVANQTDFNNVPHFSLKCPWCFKIITVQNFSEEQSSVLYLQNYFISQESQYKEKLLVEMQQNGENLPLFNKLREENNVLKSFIEGYKLGQERGKLTVPDQSLKERVEGKLWEFFSSSDIIENINQTHNTIKTQADVLQNVRSENETEKIIGKIIYAVKDEDKWGNNWVEKLEKDMKDYQADFGVIVATCYRQPLIKPYPQKNIFFTDSENFAFAGQVARLLISQKYKLESGKIKKEQRVNNLEEWIQKELPYYGEKLRQNLDNWEKEINNLLGSARKMIEIRDQLRRMIFRQIISALKEL